MIGASVDDSAPADDKTTPAAGATRHTAPDAPLPVQPGELFLGKYRIERVLGRGGMGVVMAARHERLDERVAIKFLGAASVGQKEALARFEREARAAAKIKNEHVAQVIDVGVFGEGAAYMIVEYLAGHDLSAELEDRSVLPVPDAVDYLLQAIDAIADAHALGIVHRDLKPSNLFLTRRSNGTPLIKVLDFGIAKSEALSSPDSSDSLTSTNSIMGSPRYMSPEQIRSTKTADHRSDVWSLGVILYELLTSKAPFSGDTSTELFAAVLMDTPQPPRSHRSDLPERLEAVILRCLTRDRERRYQSVAQLASDLAPFAPPRSRAIVDRLTSDVYGTATDKTLLAGHSPSVDRVPTTPTPGAPAQTDTSWTPLEPAKRRSTFTLGALGLLLLLGAGVATWQLWLQPRLEAEARLKAEPPGVAVDAAAAAPTVPEPVISATPAFAAPTVAPVPSEPPAASASANVPAAKKPRAPLRPSPSKPRGNVLEARE